jgi:hypothetical protein
MLRHPQLTFTPPCSGAWSHCITDTTRPKYIVTLRRIILSGIRRTTRGIILQSVAGVCTWSVGCVGTTLLCDTSSIFWDWLALCIVYADTDRSWRWWWLLLLFRCVKFLVCGVKRCNPTKKVDIINSVDNNVVKARCNDLRKSLNGNLWMYISAVMCSIYYELLGLVGRIP